MLLVVTGGRLKIWLLRTSTRTFGQVVKWRVIDGKKAFSHGCSTTTRTLLGLRRATTWAGVMVVHSMAARRGCNTRLRRYRVKCSCQLISTTPPTTARRRTLQQVRSTHFMMHLTSRRRTSANTVYRDPTRHTCPRQVSQRLHYCLSMFGTFV